MSNSEAQCGSAQNGTGVMAKQMEIHPDHNDVISAVESTPPSCMGKPSHASANINSSVHICTGIHDKLIHKKLDFEIMRFEGLLQDKNMNINTSDDKLHLFAVIALGHKCSCKYASITCANKLPSHM